MSIKTVLITGGAGFIGSHVADKLVEKGYKVRILDRLISQVHDNEQAQYITPGADLIVGDIRDRAVVGRALKGVDAVIHLAAEVGVGQSMYEVERYVDVNSRGTATLLDLVASGQYSIKRIIVASSMSVYGEGSYRCAEHGSISPSPRDSAQLRAHIWDMSCPICDKKVSPVPTTEDQPLNPTSIYAISKMDQELMTLSIGRHYGIGTVALRFFNTYGPRQALSNPYTGLAAIFSTQLLAGKAPTVFEDGNQARDFIHVYDTALAVVMALEATDVTDVVCNIGTGKPVTVLEVAQKLSNELGKDIEPTVTQTYRAGDIRHCWADTRRAKELFGFEAQIDFSNGAKELVEWVKDQKPTDLSSIAQKELALRDLSN
jgi:dTDP-L-rhamnose 4-epimerase